MIEHTHVGRPYWGKRYGNQFVTAKYCKKCRGYFFIYDSVRLVLKSLNKHRDKIVDKIFYENPILELWRSRSHTDMFFPMNKRD